MLSGQISFKKYSQDNIVQQSQENFQKHFKYKHFRIGCEPDFMEEYFKVSAYTQFYQCLEDEIKEEINARLKNKCKKNSLKEHLCEYKKQECSWCEEYQILKQCTPRIEW